MTCFRCVAAALACLIVVAGGCDRGESSSSSPSSSSSSAPGQSAAAAAPAKAEAGYVSGRVLGEDGKPITVADDIAVPLYGISEAGEKLSYSPAVKPDGSYRQKVAPGLYRFGVLGHVKVKHGPHTFRMPMTPVGAMWNKDREAKEGIEQDFVWHVTGKRPDVAGDPNNATHWYGMSVGMTFQTYRSDVNKSSVPPPAGTKLVFTLKPTSKCIDGRELQPITLERAWQPEKITPNDALNDLPPADYELSGVAKLPDGTTKPILLQGRGDYPAFKPSVKATLEADAITGGMWKQLVGWVVE
jgi:hypothetical protein